MLLNLNGNESEFPDGLTVAALVAQLGMKPDRVAVELNLEIVPRANWEVTILKDGDKLEVVHFVGGGSAGRGEIAQQEPPPEQEAGVSAEWRCPTCGRLVTCRFCQGCGEKKFGADDLSMRHFFSHAMGEFFHFDSKIFRTCRLLFTRPGFLTSEYLRGCRKLYLHPFQLFFVANLIYFFLQPLIGWSGLKAWLYVQTHLMFYSGFASRLAAHQMAARGMTEAQLNHAFDHAVDIQARSLVILIVPLFAFVFWLLEWRKQRYFGEHLVFSLHFTAFWLIAIFVGIYGGSTVIVRALAHVGVTFSAAHLKLVLVVLSYSTLAVYSFVALRKVYGDSILAAAVKSLLVAASFDYVLAVYQFFLFLTALYIS
jgi:thiamine biosynthesis protein ThiS